MVGSPSTSQFIQWNGTEWVPATVKTVLTGVAISESFSSTRNYGFVGGNEWGTNESICTVLPYAGTLRNFYVNVLANGLSSADTVTFTIYSGTVLGTLSATGLTTGAITGGDTGVFSDTSHSISLTAGSFIAFSVITSAGTGTFTCSFSFEVDQT